MKTFDIHTCPEDTRVGRNTDVTACVPWYSSVYASNSSTWCVQVPFEPDYQQLGGLVGAARLRGIQTGVQQQQADWVSVHNQCVLTQQ